jgi:hypothetical protein
MRGLLGSIACFGCAQTAMQDSPGCLAGFSLRCKPLMLGHRTSIACFGCAQTAMQDSPGCLAGFSLRCKPLMLGHLA